MEIFRKTLTVILAVIFFICLVSAVFIHLDYAYRMPRTPQPQVGRVYQFTANHGDVYVTREELYRANFVLDRALWIGLACFVSLAFARVFWKGRLIASSRANRPNHKLRS